MYMWLDPVYAGIGVSIWDMYMWLDPVRGLDESKKEK